MSEPRVHYSGGLRLRAKLGGKSGGKSDEVTRIEPGSSACSLGS